MGIEKTNHSRGFRAGWIILLLAGLLILLAWLFIPHLLTLAGPHQFTVPFARIAPELISTIEAHPNLSQVSSKDDLVAFALERSNELLKPDLNHGFSLDFASPRPAHCLEYSHYFGSIFNRLARRRNIPYRAFVVRSQQARFAGQSIPLPGFQNHDWVLIVPETEKAPSLSGLSSEALYLDPMLYDVFLISNIEVSVMP
ncbi:MAG: hypothetical protein KDK23_10815 [Leptospiraceae bacterium]|nr:hypothetical protein [Leptospiraceae bacterium]